MFFNTLLLLPNLVRCGHHPIFILKGQSSYGPSPKLREMEADRAPGWDLELFFFPPEVFKRVMRPWHPSLGKKKKPNFFLVLIGMSGPQVSIGINHSIRKALWKIVPEGVDGLVYANHTEQRPPSSSCVPSPPAPCPPPRVRLLSCIRHSLGSPPGTQKTHPLPRKSLWQHS